MPGDYSCLLPREKQAVRNCIKEALGITVITNLLEMSNHPAAKSIAKDAVEFEKTLPPGTDTTYIQASWMPWGWAYKDEELQKQFRTFCSKGKY